MVLALKATRPLCILPNGLSQVLGNNCCTACKHTHAGKTPSSAVPDIPASSLTSSTSPGLVESSVLCELAKAETSGCCQHPGAKEAPEPNALEQQC